jgi:hypothetical protein
MNKDSDGLCEVEVDMAPIREAFLVWAERRAVVQFLRKFNGMEAVAARIETGEHRSENWSK